jgi:hypothetical protein
MPDSPTNAEIPEVPAKPKKRGRPPKAKDAPVKSRKPRAKKTTVSQEETTPLVENLPEPPAELAPESILEIAAPTEPPPPPKKNEPLRAWVPRLSQLYSNPVAQKLALAAIVATIAFLYLFVQFRGLSSPTAMDQAQIARAIAAGEGFSTKYLRPFAIRQLELAGKLAPTGKFPDFFQSPLNSLVNALPLKIVQSRWKIGPLNVVYIADRMIAGTAIVFFLLSIAVWFQVARRLFDQKLAALGCAIILLSDLFWEFALSGLPQMLMVLIFSGVCWTTLQALKNNSSNRSATIFAGLTGLLFGLLILAHGAAAWIFMSWLVFASVVFRSRFPIVLVAIVSALLIVTPWLWRNHFICGNPLGIAGYEILAPVLESESGYFRSLSDAPSFDASRTIQRLSSALRIHTGQILSFLGLNLVALLFFASLLHKFQPTNTVLFRRAVLLMWIGAWFGMALCGVDGPVHSNQLHILFLPLFIFYGLAFALELWNRLKIPSPRLRLALPVFLILISALPLVSRLVTKPVAPIQWPPYVPPFIAILGKWFDEKEIISSDMPWAVAWYANRNSLLLPKTMKDFSKISDFRLLGESISGIYLTPITGNRRLFSEIYKGPYDDWVMLIERPPPDPLQFILPFFTPLPIDGECILYADRDRWSRWE